MCFPASHLQPCSSTTSSASISSSSTSPDSSSSSTSMATASNCTNPGLQSCCGQWCCPQQYFRSHPIILSSSLPSLLCVFFCARLSILMTRLGIPMALVVTSFVLLSCPSLIFVFFLVFTYSLIGFLVLLYCSDIYDFFNIQHRQKNYATNLTGSGRTRSVSATPSARLGEPATFAVGTPAVMSCQRRRRRSTRRNTTTTIWTRSTSTSLGLTWTTNLLRMRWETWQFLIDHCICSVDKWNPV